MRGGKPYFTHSEVFPVPLTYCFHKILRTRCVSEVSGGGEVDWWAGDDEDDATGVATGADSATPAHAHAAEHPKRQVGILFPLASVSYVALGEEPGHYTKGGIAQNK